MKQGTSQLHDTVVELDNAIGQLLNVSNYKFIFILLPRSIRKFIPLKYWPCEYPYDALKLNVIDHHIIIWFVFQQHANLSVDIMILYLTASIDMLRWDWNGRWRNHCMKSLYESKFFLEFQLRWRVRLPTWYNETRFFAKTIYLFWRFSYGLDVTYCCWWYNFNVYLYHMVELGKMARMAKPNSKWDRQFNSQFDWEIRTLAVDCSILLWNMEMATNSSLEFISYVDS